MVQQVTNGIKISVKTSYNGKYIGNQQQFHAFSYAITIENQSNDTVQLSVRHWNIHDSLKEIEIVEGEGVVGNKPTIAPQEKYTYSSNCFLDSPIGSMNGYFVMVNFTTSKKFKVHIPSFQLTAPSALN